ncbi:MULTISPECIES: septum formation initiator family protein [unclassified Microbacterium]|uniref:FtsB family cell division protein n=1 Tax=unclassified Microbacterium TaxID=2609290 RepID=UPI001E533450|nr:septum formation initiator family protein [Microbacterium sp. Au-Mic1]MCE4026437.1 septum formation initiator family protein [Microbacterium sp. Au-Mic1]
MTSRRTPPSSSAAAASGVRPAGRPERAAPARAVDVRGWVGGIRLSGFMVIMLSLVVLGAWVLVPTLGTYLDQKQRIAALEHSVQVTQKQIDALTAERQRWNDPAYITAQARERLFYVKPGEVVYLIDNDIDPAAQPVEQAPVSDTVQEKSSDWAGQLLRSVTGAGLAKTAAGSGAR